MKKIGFLSFGHWTPSPQSQVRSASDALLQSIDLAVAAEELGADGAYFRVHHFARQIGSPFPLLAANLIAACAGAHCRSVEPLAAIQARQNLVHPLRSGLWPLRRMKSVVDGIKVLAIERLEERFSSRLCF